MGPNQKSHPREANEQLLELPTEASISDNSIDIPSCGPAGVWMAETLVVPGISPSMMMGYNLARFGLPLDIQSITQGFSYGVAEAFSRNVIGKLDYFSNPVPSTTGVIPSQIGVHSFSGELWSISGSPGYAEEYPTGYESDEGFFGFLGSSVADESANGLQKGNTSQRDLSRILQEQGGGITAGSLSAVNIRFENDNLPEFLIETQSESVEYGHSAALADSAEGLSDNECSPTSRTGSLTPLEDPISLAQEQESDQEVVASPAWCINPADSPGHSPEPEVSRTPEEPSPPLSPSIDIIDLTLESDETTADMAASTADSATSPVVDPAAGVLTSTPNSLYRRAELSRTKKRNQQKRKRCYEEDAQSFPEIVTLRVISVKVEKESSDGFMETVEFIRHKSRKWKAKDSDEECIFELQEVASFEMMVQGGSFGRIHIDKSENANTYKGTEPLMEYMVELSNEEAKKVLDDPEQSLDTRCHLLQEQKRTKAPRVA
ncbi:hypothetical protein IL306_005020 [Fusarium sp. DS 682]|nr:hypothetical protein IL306_005020 [Fusarium sp. DS 682]